VIDVFYILVGMLFLAACVGESRVYTYVLIGIMFFLDVSGAAAFADGALQKAAIPHLAAFNLALVAAFMFAKKRACVRKRIDKERAEAEQGLAEVKQEYDSISARAESISAELENRKNLYQVARNMAAVIEFDALLREIQAGLSAFFVYESAWMLMLTGEDADVAFDLCHPECFSTGEEVISPVLQAKLSSVGQIVYMPSEVFSDQDRHFPDAVESCIAVPLDYGGRPAALVLVFNFRDPPDQQRLHEDSFDIIGALKNQFTIALNKCFLYRDIESASRVDALTGLSKRWYFLQRLHEEIERSDRRGSPLSIIMADIDRFKRFNDTYGHLAGDAVLKRTANLIRLNLRSADLACRYGGEEFLLALPDTVKESAGQVAERIREEVGKTEVVVRNARTTLTLSLGVAAYPIDGSPTETVIKKADQMLYEAKRAGRNRTCIAPSPPSRADESDDSHMAIPPKPQES